MFGLGAGWANVPVLNLMMGAPLKISVATSKFLLSITDTSAAWIYVNNGAVLPIMVVPSIIGIMLGSVVGVQLLTKVKPAAIRWMVIGLLTFAGGAGALQGPRGLRHLLDRDATTGETRRWRARSRRPRSSGPTPGSSTGG